MMMEPESDKSTEQARSRAILWVGAAAALLLTALIVLLARSRPENKPVLENVVRAGNPEFDRYKPKIELEVVDKITHPNMIGMFQLEVRARLTNRGDRTLTGIEVIGRMLDMNEKVISQAVSLPVPRSRSEPLNPGESVSFSVKVDAPGKMTEDEIKDVAIEVLGLRFK